MIETGASYGDRNKKNTDEGRSGEVAALYILGFFFIEKSTIWFDICLI